MKKSRRPRFRGKLMARVVSGVRYDSRCVDNILRDVDDSHLPCGRKALLIDEYIQATRERCHVLQAEVDDWRDKMSEWEKEKG